MKYSESTIPDYISAYRRLDISYDKCNFKELIEIDGVKMIINSKSILDKYIEELDLHTYTIKLSEEAMRDFMYNPKALSLELYNTTEFWYMLLHANEMYSICEFKKDTIKVYNSNISIMVQEILNIEKPYIDSNNAKLDDDILNKV